MYYHRGGNSANKSHENEKLPNICVVGGCSNVTDTEKGISLHFIPFQWRRDARSEKETG